MMRRVPDPVIRFLWVLSDGAAWALAIVFTVWIRLQYDIERAFVTNTWIVAGSAALIHLAICMLSGPYMGKHARGSIDQEISVAHTTALTIVMQAERAR